MFTLVFCVFLERKKEEEKSVTDKLVVIRRDVTLVVNYLFLMKKIVLCIALHLAIFDGTFRNSTNIELVTRFDV